MNCSHWLFEKDGYQWYTLPKELIDGIFLNPKLEWEQYDEEMRRCLIDCNGDNQITLSKALNLYRTNDEQCSCKYKGLHDEMDVSWITHYIEYHFTEGRYEIRNHQDVCPFTVIVYLSCDTEIHTDFKIEGKSIDFPSIPCPSGSYRALMFSSTKFAVGLEHSTVFTGKGKRRILCFFGDINYYYE
jgi:hypothetical protein